MFCFTYGTWEETTEVLIMEDRQYATEKEDSETE